jgi:L,D-peptidoglycan transpeptidase YkuD (ErfK/YbiS/YcfS/YnhG family)
MIIVKKSGYLIFNNFKFRCALGKSGIKKKRGEGDFITPKGSYKLIKIYYRADKIQNLKTNLKKIKIRKNMAWCDDPKSNFYNKLINLPTKFGHEKLYRNDNLYDLIIILNYNMRPIIKNKGSAIFIHVAKRNYAPTQGCIALSKIHLRALLKNINKKEEIKII